MSSEAWTSLLEASSKRPSLRRLSDAELELVCSRVSQRFVNDADSPWWWTSLRGTVTTISYSGPMAADAITKLVRSDETPVVLVLTNEHPRPAGAVEGPLRDVLAAVSDSIGFEYLLTTPDAAWVLFDTHHNELIYAQAEPANGPADTALT
jgi:hypothetical protein